MDNTDTHGNSCRMFRTHGDGKYELKYFAKYGRNIILEEGIHVFHPEHIELGDNVYVGHGAYLKGYYKNKLVIGDNVWIGQQSYLHAGGGILIEDGVGIGPFVKILTINHVETEREIPILYQEQECHPVKIEYGVDVGVGAIILPGVVIGKYSIIGAGAVVTKNIPAYSVATGIPAKVSRKR